MPWLRFVNEEHCLTEYGQAVAQVFCNFGLSQVASIIRRPIGFGLNIPKSRMGWSYVSPGHRLGTRPHTTIQNPNGVAPIRERTQTPRGQNTATVERYQG